MAFAWLTLANNHSDPDADEVDELEALEDGDEWVDPEMEDLPESDTSHQATLNPYTQLQDPAMWADATADQRRLLHILQPWIEDANDTYTLEEFLAEIPPELTLLFDPGAIVGPDATWVSRTIEGR